MDSTKRNKFSTAGCHISSHDTYQSSYNNDAIIEFMYLYKHCIYRTFCFLFFAFFPSFYYKFYHPIIQTISHAEKDHLHKLK